MKRTIIYGTALVAAFGIAGFGAMSMTTGASSSSPPANTVDEPVARNTTAALLPVAGKTTESGGFTGDVVEGKADAKLTIIEYTSFTCPHCRAFHEDIYTPLKADYIDTGKIRFIYRDFPLDNPSLAASIVSRCGGEEKYLGFVDLFMTQQERWRTSGDVFGELKEMAKLGGLGGDQIDFCLGDVELGQSIVDRAQIAETAFDVNATPTILINGERYAGRLTLEAFKAQLDARLGE